MSAARVTGLTRYPVKACAGESLDEVEVGPDGLDGDRLLAVTVGDVVVTQREHAHLARVRPVLDHDGSRLTLRYDDRDPVTAGLSTDGPGRTVTLFGAPVVVVDQSPELSRWLSEVVGEEARLVMAPDSSRRPSPGRVSGHTVLSDEGTVSLHSQASLDTLNERLAARGHPPVGSERFRANLVIDGCAAHAEDDADAFAVGERVVLPFAQLDDRCVVTTVDQAAGRRAGPEPIRTLATYRRGPQGGGVRFGIYTAVAVGGRVRVGDPVVLRPS